MSTGSLARPKSRERMSASSRHWAAPAAWKGVLAWAESPRRQMWLLKYVGVEM